MPRIRKVRVMILSLSIAMTVLAGTALADPLVIEAMGLDVWHVGQLEQELRNAQVRDTKLDNELQLTIDRATIHKLMLEDMVSGRRTLQETAERKWEMNQNRDVVVNHLKRNRIGSTMEAKMAHDFIIMAIEFKLEIKYRIPIKDLCEQYRIAYGTELTKITNYRY